MEHYFDLALEASGVSIAMDNHILGRATKRDYQNIVSLSERLHNIAGNHESAYDLIIAGTIWRDREYWKGKTREDVKLKTWLLAKDLESFSEFPEERQKEIRDVCVRLSIKAMSYSIPFMPKFAA